MRTNFLAFVLLAAACGTAAPAQVAVDSGNPTDADAAAADAHDAVAADAPADTALDAAATDAALAKIDAAADTASDCAVTGCSAEAKCLADGSCCTPSCTAKCGGVADGCGGTCAKECAGVCTAPTVAPTPLYRAFAFKPQTKVDAALGCAQALGVVDDGTRITDASDTAAYSAGNSIALAFQADDLIGKADSLDLLAGLAGGSCGSGSSTCQLKVWTSAFNPFGLPGPCPGRAVLHRDADNEKLAFRQDETSAVPSFVPLFLFGGPAEALAPWVRVHKLLALPSTNNSLPGMFCGAVTKIEMDAAIAKLSAQQLADPSVTQLKSWLAEHDAGIDLDGDGNGDGFPFAFTLGIVLAGPSTVIK